MRPLVFGLILFVLAAVPALAQNQAQPQLETAPLAIQTQAGQRYVFDVELALTQRQQATGLMFRTTMPANGGMLFIFPQERPASFWMRNTYLPLDIIFIRGDGKIANIAQRTEPCSETSLPSDGNVRAVLELNAGTTEQLAIRPGDQIIFPLEEDAANSNERPAPPGPTARAC